MAGFSPIITTASLRNTPLLESLGATNVLDRTLSPTETFSAIASILGTTPLEFVYDAISLPGTQAMAYEALSPGGKLIIVLHDRIPQELKKEGDGKTIAHVFGSTFMPDNRKCGEAMMSHLNEGLSTGVIKVRKSEIRCRFKA